MAMEPFSRRSLITLGGEPYWIAVADFNGDGKADIAVSNGSLSILLGNGDGTFQLPVSYSVSSWTLVTGDFNGDGKADVAFTSGAGFSVMLGNGDGTLQSPITYVLSAIGEAIAAGDFNGDGKTDLAVSDTSGGVNISLGNGDGTFQTAVSYPVGAGPYNYSLIVSDFNGEELSNTR
jgi:hypothetical protein